MKKKKLGVKRFVLVLRSISTNVCFFGCIVKRRSLKIFPFPLLQAKDIQRVRLA